MKKLSKLLCLLKFTRPDLNLENRLIHYKTFNEIIISNALVVYGKTNSNNLHTISLFPKKFFRVIFRKSTFAHFCRLFEPQVFKPFMSFMPQPKLGFLWKILVHSPFQRLKKPRGQIHYLFSGKNFSEQQVNKFSVEDRGIKVINNLKTSGAWPDDLVTSARSAKKKSLHCLKNNFGIGNAIIFDFFK